MKTEHTPTPWRVANYSGMVAIESADGSCICAIGMDQGDGGVTGSAEFIVTACNSYDALADALRNILNGLRLGKDDDSPYWDATITNAESALKAAGVEL